MPPKINKLIYDFLATSKKRINWLMGGASAGKSWAIVQDLILEKLVKEKNIGILVLRKTKPAVKSSCLRLFERWLVAFSVPYHLNKTELIIRVGSNKVFFDSLDDIEKKKSFEGINYIWMEEVTEFTLREFLRLNIGCRDKNENGINQIFASFNPIDPIGNEWIKKRTDNPPANEQVMVLTYKHNPFLSKEEIHSIEMLADEDDEYDKIYRLGEWATPSFIIYTNWEVIHKWPENPEESIWGLDFGYNNPSALIEIAIADGICYEREHLYESKLTNSQLIEKLKLILTNRNQALVADCAEPARIMEIQNAGFNCFACKKGKDSVRRGIDVIKSRRRLIDYNSPSLIKELQGYKWKCNKDGEICSPEEPLAFRDHLMDARRYAYEFLLDLAPAGMVTTEQYTEPTEHGDEVITNVANIERVDDPDLIAEDGDEWTDMGGS